jgi:UDPglucose 6-dehydrogenase
VRAVAEEIGTYMNHDMIVVDKSTVPVGTADEVTEIIRSRLDARKETYHFSVVSNPEFLKEGDAIKDCMRPDRVVVGVDDPNAGAVIHELYKPFIKKSDRYYQMDVRSAERTKYAANAMLATKISFMNEIANICERVGADVNNVRIGIGSDSRIGYSFIYPGIGYGGSCFPKDVKSLIKEAEKASYIPELLQSVENTNKRQKQVLSEKIVVRFGEDLTGLTFAVWGLSFKPNTDDMREAPSVAIIGELTSRGAKIQAYDPEAMAVSKKNYFGVNSNVSYGTSKYGVLDGADALLLLTEWKEFLSADFTVVKDHLKTPLLFDGRNQYDADSMKRKGIEYHQIGVGK